MCHYPVLRPQTFISIDTEFLSLDLCKQQQWRSLSFLLPDAMQTTVFTDYSPLKLCNFQNYGLCNMEPIGSLIKSRASLILSEAQNGLKA